MFTGITNITKLEWRNGTGYHFKLENGISLVQITDKLRGQIVRMKLNWQECMEIQMGKITALKKKCSEGWPGR